MGSVFTDDDLESAYQDFLNNKTSIHNSRIRPDGVSLWDALSESQENLFNSPDGAVLDSLAKDIFKDNSKV
jgi:hypothetical protein